MPATSHVQRIEHQLTDLAVWDCPTDGLLLRPGQGVLYSGQQPSPPLSEDSSRIASSLTTSPTLPSTVSSYGLHPSGSVKSSPKKRSLDSQASSPHEIEDPATKRQRNTEAARRYRQRKMDRVTELEEALAAMTKDRDDLRLRLARSEAEASVLRGMVGK